MSMDHQEQTVHKYLISAGYREDEIEFEPDGNIPPDFVVRGEIAIEVRRLNQHSEVGGRKKGLEVDSLPFYQSVSQVLPEFNGSIEGKTFFVFLRYGRPLPKAKRAKQITREVLEDFCTNPSGTKQEISVSENLTFVIFPASYREGVTFLMGGDSDHQRGGWLLEQMEVNIQHCSDEKEIKVQPYRKKYPIWWLALVDHIGYGLDSFDRELFNDQVSIEHNWDKIMLIAPNKEVPAIEI